MLKVKLNNGIEMPQLGIGTYNNKTNENAREMVGFAFKNGYTHVDTAHAYYDEKGVGQGIKDAGVKREDIWITSKLWPTEYGEGKTLEAIDKMLKRIDTPYLDLVFLHQPVGDYIGAYKDLEKAVEMGKVKSIGLSDFDYAPERMNEIMKIAKIKPAVLQLEIHPYYHQTEMREKAAKYDIQVESWFPLGGADFGLKTLLADPVLNDIAKAHNKTAAQVILRWHIQEGLVVIPGAMTHEEALEDIDIFDFELSQEEMDRINKLERGRFFPAPKIEDLEKMCLSINNLLE